MPMIREKFANVDMIKQLQNPAILFYLELFLLLFETGDMQLMVVSKIAQIVSY
jgi:hypothetical protein